MAHSSLLLVEEVSAAASPSGLLVVVALLLSAPASLLRLTPSLLLIPTSLLLSVCRLGLAPRLCRLAICLRGGLNRGRLDDLRLLNRCWLGLGNYLTGLGIVRCRRNPLWWLWLRDRYRWNSWRRGHYGLWYWDVWCTCYRWLWRWNIRRACYHRLRGRDIRWRWRNGRLVGLISIVSRVRLLLYAFYLIYPSWANPQLTFLTGEGGTGRGMACAGLVGAGCGAGTATS